MLQEARTHHRREGERDDGGDQDGDGQGHGKLAEEPADDVAHEQQRDQDSDQRDGEGDDGEADLLGAAQGGTHRRFTLFDVADDVLDHHDGVVHDEAGGDGQRHQRQVVEAVAEQVHHAERADQRERDGHAGNDGGREVAQEEEDDHDHQRHGQQEFELDILYRSADGVGAVGEDADLNGFRQRRSECGQQRLDPVHDLNDVGAGLPLDVHDDGGNFVHPGGLAQVFDVVHDIGDVGEFDGRAIAVGEDQRTVVV